MRYPCVRPFAPARWLGLMVGLVLIFPAAAQDPGSPEEPADTADGAADATTVGGTGPGADEIIVTASRHPEPTFDVPMGVTVVDSREMREKNARTAAEALRFKPGIWVQKTGHLGGAPVLRGFMGNRVVYLFDGIRRNTAGLFKGPNSFLQNIDALDIDRIEVVRGPGSVLYGSDAIGGIINVISNERPLYSDQPTSGGSLFGRTARVDRELSGRLEGYFSDDHRYGFVGVTRRDIQSLHAGEGVGKQKPGAWREENWDAQFDYRFDDGAEVELFVQDFSRPEGARFDRPNWKQQNDRELAGLRYRAEGLGFMDAFEGTAYFHDQRSFIDEKFWDSDGDETTFGFELQGTSYPDEDLRLVYGLHFHKDDLTKSNPQKGTESPDVQWDNPAAFMLTEWQVNDRLRLDAGLRWDQFTLNSDAPPLTKLDSALQDAINNGAFALSDLELDETDDAFTGGVGAVYDLTDTVRLVGHVGRAFRAPNQSDLLDFGQFTFGFGVPTPSLDPESSWTYEAGVRVHTDEFAGSITGFATTVEDAITSAPGTFNGSSFVDVNGNGVQDGDEGVFVKSNSDGKLRVHGIELEARQWLPESIARSIADEGHLSWFGNGTWIIGQDSGTGEPLDRAFPANALLGLRMDQDRDPAKSRYWWSVDTWMVRHFGRIPDSRLNSDPAFKQDPQNKSSPLLRSDGSVPGFALLNLRGGRRLSDRVTLTYGVENIFNRKYRVKDSRIDGPGRNLFVGIHVAF